MFQQFMKEKGICVKFVENIMLTKEVWKIILQDIMKMQENLTHKRGNKVLTDKALIRISLSLLMNGLLCTWMEDSRWFF